MIWLAIMIEATLCSEGLRRRQTGSTQEGHGLSAVPLLSR